MLYALLRADFDELLKNFAVLLVSIRYIVVYVVWYNAWIKGLRRKLTVLTDERQIGCRRQEKSTQLCTQRN